MSRSCRPGGSALTRRVVRTIVTAALLTVSGPVELLPQAETARALLREGLARAAAGDTAAALDQLRAAVDADPELAEAHYQLGRLLTRSASTVETEFRERRAAESALMDALSLDQGNPAYLAELGMLRFKQNMTTDARRLLNRALERAEEIGVQDSVLLAELHFNLGYVHERLYDGQRHRRIVSPIREPLSAEPTPDGSPFLKPEVEGWLDEAPPIEGSGSREAELMFEHYRAALRFEPGHLPAGRRLLVHLLESNQLGEYLSIAGRLARLHPDTPEALLALALGLHAAGREEEAGEAFRTALDGMSEAERAPYMDLGPVLRRRSEKLYRELEEGQRLAFEESFWRIGDPLYLTEANERRLEHWARVAYADLRFSEPATGRRGWQTDRGIIFIRYGPPDEIARAGGLIWTYEGGRVFQFNQTPGYARTRFAGDYGWVARAHRHAVPAVYANIPSIPVMLPLDVQLARFRGESPTEVALEVHAELPLEAMAEGMDLTSGELETGVFVLDAAGRKLLRQVETRVVDYDEASTINPLRSWRLLLPSTGKLVLGVEARDATTWRSATSRDTVTADPFPSGSLSISDILLADMVRPLAEDPLEREDLDIQPNPGRRFTPGQLVHIYYEIYDLRSDAEGFAGYDVSLAVRVKELHREGLMADLLGPLADAWGFTIKGDDRVELEYGREIRLDHRDRTIEYLSLDLQKAPPGEYEIMLRIWDRVGEKLASRIRTFTVVEEPD